EQQPECGLKSWSDHLIEQAHHMRPEARKVRNGRWVFGGEPIADSIQLSLRGGDGCGRRQATHHAPSPHPSLETLRSLPLPPPVERRGDPELRLLIRKRERRWHDTDDARRRQPALSTLPEVHRLPDDARVSAEAPLPEGVAKHGHGRPPVLLALRHHSA